MSQLESNFAEGIMNPATRIVASVFGFLVGLAGLEHGYFLVKQGNKVPNAFFIDAIGPESKFWEGAGAHAVTLIPNYFLSGVLAIIVGSLVIIWSIGFIHRKYGARIQMLISVILFLVGGGFNPIYMAVLSSLTATQIDKPLNWWRTNLREKQLNFLARLWPLSLISFLIVFFLAVMTQIFGWPIAILFGVENTESIMGIFAVILLGLLPLPTITGIASDIQK